MYDTPYATGCKILKRLIFFPALFTLIHNAAPKKVNKNNTLCFSLAPKWLTQSHYGAE